MGNNEHSGKKLLGSGFDASLACADVHKATREKGEVAAQWEFKLEGVETENNRTTVEAAEDVMGEISIEDITTCIPNAARAVEFETTRGIINWKMKAEHLEAEKNLRRRMGGEGL